MKTITGNLDGKELKIGIVVSRFNQIFTKQLLAGALDALAKHGVADDNIIVVHVPGAFEIPFVLQKLAAAKKCDALIALGVVIQGATNHAALITSAVATACTEISTTTGIPVIDGVIGAQNSEQAAERSDPEQANRGCSAAETAIEMANLARHL